MNGGQKKCQLGRPNYATAIREACLSTASHKILIVDDEVGIRRSLRTALTSQCFDITEAARGEEALSLVRSGRYDCVLLDLNMPGIGGLETCPTC